MIFILHLLHRAKKEIEKNELDLDLISFFYHEWSRIIRHIHRQ